MRTREGRLNRQFLHHFRYALETSIAAGLAGLGIMQGMDLFLHPWLKSGELVEVLPNNPVPSRKLSLIYPHRHVSRKVRVFAEWLATIL